MKPLALQLYTVRELAPKDPVGTLKRVAEIGYKGVEGSSSYYGRTMKEYRQLLDDLGLKASSTWIPIPTRENLQQVIDTTGTMGCTCGTVGRGPEAYRTADDIRKLADELQAGAQLLEGTDLKLCVHNHWWEFEEVDGRLGEEILLERAPAVNAELDIYWAHNFGAVDVPAIVRKYRKRIPLMHVKDGMLVKPPQGQRHQFTAVGRGEVNVPPIIKAADQAVLQWLIVEIDEVEGDMMEAVEASYRYMIDNKLAEGNK